MIIWTRNTFKAESIIIGMIPLKHLKPYKTMLSQVRRFGDNILELS